MFGVFLGYIHDSIFKILGITILDNNGRYTPFMVFRSFAVLLKTW
jgi:hypothetical protein